jgi:hypothetical protein
MGPVSSITTASASLGLMVSQNGLDLTVHCECVRETSLGSATSSVLTICLRGPNAPTRVNVTEYLAHAIASRVMMVLLVREVCVQMIAMGVVRAGQRNIWLPELTECTRLLGMQ